MTTPRTGRLSRHPASAAVTPTVTVGPWPHAVFGVAFAGYWAFVAWLWPRLPERIPAHVNGMGEVDRWGGRTDFAALVVILGLLCLLAGPGSRALTRFRGVTNIPHEEYWKTDEHWPVARTIVGRAMSAFGALLVVFAAAMIWDMAGRAMSDTHPAWFFWLALGLFLAATVAWAAWLHRLMRVPAAS